MKKPSPEQIHALFSKQIGAYAIATPININAIIAFCVSKKPKRVLELGGGIGTLTYCVLNYTEAIVEVYEENGFCREKLRQNLNRWSERVVLKESYAQTPNLTEYDLVMIDGPDSVTIEERDRLTYQVLGGLRNIRSFFIEGSRYSQRQLAQSKMADISLYFLERVRGREVEGLGLMKGGLFVHKAGYSPKLIRYFCHLLWLVYDSFDFMDPRRRNKIKVRLRNPFQTMLRFFRRFKNRV
jgi:hypothetical protein